MDNKFYSNFYWNGTDPINRKNTMYFNILIILILSETNKFIHIMLSFERSGGYTMKRMFIYIYIYFTNVRRFINNQIYASGA